MSQDASARPKLLQPSEAPPFSESFGSDVAESSRFPVESYADRLMDDLFGDVERLLDGSTKLTTEPVRSEPPASSPKASPLNDLVDLVAPLMRRSDVEAALAPDDRDTDVLLANRDLLTNRDLLANQESEARSSTQKPLSESADSAGRSYDRLLLGVGCLSIMTTLAVWLLNQQAIRQPAPVAVAPPPSIGNASPESPAVDNQFIGYLQQALKAIDQRQVASSQVGSTGTPTNLPSVPPGSPTIQTPAPGTATPSNANRPATGLSRLYVPVYQVPQAQPGNPSVAPLPSANAPTTVRPPIPLSMPGVPKTLVGVLELGDRSAALIEINGVTQRYRIGESIATSGWTLVEVSKNQAIIRRNGEVRSVFTGQSF